MAAAVTPGFWGNTQHRWHDSSSFWRRHSLSLFLGGLVLAQTAGAAVLLWFVWRNAWDTFQAGQTPGLWVFAVFFAGQYLLSLVADSYGALLQVVATKWFIETGSEESK